MVHTKEGTVSIKQAMALMGVSRTTLFKWLREEKIQHQRQINNQILIDEKSLNDFISERLAR